MPTDRPWNAEECPSKRPYFAEDEMAFPDNRARLPWSIAGSSWRAASGVAILVRKI